MPYATEAEMGRDLAGRTILVMGGSGISGAAVPVYRPRLIRPRRATPAQSSSPQLKFTTPAAIWMPPSRWASSSGSE